MATSGRRKVVVQVEGDGDGLPPLTIAPLASTRPTATAWSAWSSEPMPAQLAITTLADADDADDVAQPADAGVWPQPPEAQWGWRGGGHEARRPDGYEVLRVVFVPPDLAHDRLDEWWPRSVRTRSAHFRVTDHTGWSLRGEMKRRGRRCVPIELTVEPRNASQVAVRLTPDLHRRRYRLPNSRWWRATHQLTDAMVAALTLTERRIA